MIRDGQRIAASDDASTTTSMYEGRSLANPGEDIYDQGLAFDLQTLVDRRRMLKVIGAGFFAFVGCRSSSEAPAGSTTPGTAGGGTAEDCAVIVEETAGPFPGDGSNGPDVLSQSGVVRADIRSSFGELSGTAEGIPLTIELTIQDAANGCANLAGAAVYVWQCDRDGGYSLYSEGVTDQNYLRGVQEAGSDGVVTFQSIYPACYPGRWPHIHFEVYPDLASATDDANRIATSQVALPEDACVAVYATDGYTASVASLQQVSLESDNVFGDDGGASQLGAISGDVDGGYVVELAVPVQTA